MTYIFDDFFALFGGVTLHVIVIYYCCCVVLLSLLRCGFVIAALDFGELFRLEMMRGFAAGVCNRFAWMKRTFPCQHSHSLRVQRKTAQAGSCFRVQPSRRNMFLDRVFVTIYIWCIMVPYGTHTYIISFFLFKYNMYLRERGERDMNNNMLCMV